MVIAQLFEEALLYPLYIIFRHLWARIPYKIKV